MSRTFWDAQYSRRAPEEVHPVTWLAGDDPLQRDLYQCCGDLTGKRVLDLGCGGGEQAVMMAKLGAEVTAVDLSPQAVARTKELAEVNRVASQVCSLVLDAMELGQLQRRFDLVFGKYILHHIEPFDQFVPVLHGILVPGGRAVFLENNARNPVLMFARRHVAGRFGIPRYGDDEEHPLEVREIEMLEALFERVELRFPELVFLRKINTYVFRHDLRFRPIMRVIAYLDELAFRWWPAIRQYSYDQIIVLDKAAHAPEARSYPLR